MPMYEFDCPECGPFDAMFSLAAVPSSTDCRCGTAALRKFTPPRLGRGGTAMKLLDATKATADTPAVVGRVPDGPRPRRTPTSGNPLHAKLPRS